MTSNMASSSLTVVPRGACRRHTAIPIQPSIPKIEEKGMEALNLPKVRHYWRPFCPFRSEMKHDKLPRRRGPNRETFVKEFSCECGVTLWCELIEEAAGEPRKISFTVVGETAEGAGEMVVPEPEFVLTLTGAAATRPPLRGAIVPAPAISPRPPSPPPPPPPPAGFVAPPLLMPLNQQQALVLDMNIFMFRQLQHQALRSQHQHTMLVHIAQQQHAMQQEMQVFRQHFQQQQLPNVPGQGQHGSAESDARAREPVVEEEEIGNDNSGWDDDSSCRGTGSGSVHHADPNDVTVDADGGSAFERSSDRRGTDVDTTGDRGTSDGHDDNNDNTIGEEEVVAAGDVDDAASASPCEDREAKKKRRRSCDGDGDDDDGDSRLRAPSRRSSEHDDANDESEFDANEIGCDGMGEEGGQGVAMVSLPVDNNDDAAVSENRHDEMSGAGQKADSAVEPRHGEDGFEILTSSTRNPCTPSEDSVVDPEPADDAIELGHGGEDGDGFKNRPSSVGIPEDEIPLNQEPVDDAAVDPDPHDTDFHQLRKSLHDLLKLVADAIDSKTDVSHIPRSPDGRPNFSLLIVNRRLSWMEQRVLVPGTSTVQVLRQLMDLVRDVRARWAAKADELEGRATYSMTYLTEEVEKWSTLAERFVPDKRTPYLDHTALLLRSLAFWLD